MIFDYEEHKKIVEFDTKCNCTTAMLGYQSFFLFIGTEQGCLKIIDL